MANKTVSLYQSVKIKGEWTFRKTPSSRLKRLPEGDHYFSWYEGSEEHMNPLGPEPDVALAAFQTKARELVFIAAGGELKKDQDCNRQQTQVKIADAVQGYLSDCQDRQGKSGYGLAGRTVEAYRYRLGFLIEFQPDTFLDEIDAAMIKRFRTFLRVPPDDLGGRTCYNIMQATSSFLIKHDLMAAKPILKEMAFHPGLLFRIRIASWIRSSPRAMWKSARSTFPTRFQRRSMQP